MPLLPFRELTPDLTPVNNPNLIAAVNAYPLGPGYKAVPSQNVVSDALTARARAFVTHVDTSDTYHSYAGDATQLYKLSGTAWSVASTSHTLGSEEGWEFARFNDDIVAVSIGEVPEKDAIGTGTFATFIGGSTVPKAHHVATVQNFLVMGDINDGAVKRNGLIWSAQGDITDFDASLATQAGAQLLDGDGGVINKVIGGYSGTIFQQHAIWRMTYQGPPLIFRFDRIFDNIGAISKGGVAKQGDGIFFLSEDGFFLVSDEHPGRLLSIGKDRVDNTVLNEIDKTSLHRCSTAVDPETGIFLFSYPTGAGDPTKIAMYNPSQDRWGFIELDHQLVGIDRGKGTGDIDSAPLATVDIDAASYNIDSAEYKGGAPSVAVFDQSNKLAQLSGNGYLKASFDTGEVRQDDGRRAYINRIRPVITGMNSTITAAVATRETLADTSTFSGEVGTNSEGEVPIRASGRYMKFRISVEDGFDDALGLDVTPRPRGRK